MRLAKGLKPRPTLSPEVEVARLTEENDRLKERIRMLEFKMQTGTFFTPEQLIEHDKRERNEARKSYKAACRAELQKEHEAWVKEMDAHIEERWDEAKAEFKNGSAYENWIAWMRVTMAVPVKVLVEDFHWKALTEECCGDNRQRLVKFLNRCAWWFEDMRDSEDKDIRWFADQVMEETGAGYVLKEEDE